MRLDLMIERRSINRLNDEILRKNLRDIVNVVSRNKQFRMKGQIGRLHEPAKIINDQAKEEYQYRVKLRIEKEGFSQPDVVSKHLAHAKKLVIERARSYGWRPMEAPSEFVAAPARPVFVVPTLDDKQMHEITSGIYDREQHVRVIHDGVVDFFDTLAKHQTDAKVEVSRSHVLLKGPPAGAKTSLFERLKKWYEKDNGIERVTFVDATTTSKAGLENWLLDKAENGTLTDIVVLEEIEKQPLDNLLTLVSLMGSGYIAKMNARVGHRKELAQILVWATCNQEEIIQNFRNGVLWSRFSNKLHCTRPSRERMHQILCDKIKQRHGNVKWADAAIEFAYETINKEFGKPMDDPRDVIALLAGRNRLLDGSYQSDRLDILRAETVEKEMMRANNP